MAVVEDEAVLAGRARELFSARGWHVEAFADAESALAAFERAAFDIALLDIHLAGKASGLDLLFEIRDRGYETEAIILTGQASLESAVQALSLRAFAYLTKPVDEDQLDLEVAKAQEMVRLRRENGFLMRRLMEHERELESRVEEATRKLAEANRRLAAANLELSAEASHDGLTGLHNYRHFMPRLRAELARAIRHGSEVGVIMLDVDHFKDYNDTYGHLSGNHALVQLAELIRDETRAHDVAARIGGEEFAVLMIECDRDRTVTSAQRIRHAVETAVFPGRRDGKGCTVTVSLGVAIGPTDARDPDRLLSQADEALYAAKGAGRNRVAYWVDGVEGEQGSAVLRGPGSMKAVSIPLGRRAGRDG
jgi:diguanylate cyclase (GGDEF)-like protein